MALVGVPSGFRPGLGSIVEGTANKRTAQSPQRGLIDPSPIAV
jgi:hypothetical protein